MGRAVARAVGVIRRHILLFGAFAIIVQLPPVLMVIVILLGIWISPLVGGLLGLFMLLAGYLAVQAAVAHATLVALDDERPRLRAALARSLRLVLPVLGLCAVMSFGVLLGVSVLVVPGIILFVMWSVAVPAMVDEDLGVFASLGRSRELTRGSRWSIFLLLAAIVLLGVLVQLAVQLLADGVPQTIGAGTGVAVEEWSSDGSATSRGGIAIAELVGFLLNGVVYVVFGVLIAAIYAELRDVREGAGPRNLAEIFA